MFVMKRLECIERLIAVVCVLSLLSVSLISNAQSRPNIVLLMADDLGWGDVGFNGNTVIQTPHLDEMASRSMRLTRFYSAAPVCSPTRGSCLTGRNAERYGIYFANVGHLDTAEITLGELLQRKGYSTGHFGKWHLGTLTRTEPDGHRGGKDKFKEHYAPPWEHGFDVSFSTEQAVPTWNPMEAQTILTKFWTGPGEYATDNLSGDASRVIMDRAIPFIEQSVSNGKPFLSVIWLHAPHTPVVAGPEYLERYKDLDEDHRHYYGCITAMDEQIGRLRSKLRELGVDQNTVIFFASDNGPAGEGGGILQHAGKRQQGTTGPFKGRKGSLYEGGIRVPALIEWPAIFTEPGESDLPLSTNDYLPTIAKIVGAEEDLVSSALDGIDMMTLLKKDISKRPGAIAFRSYDQIAYIDNRFKIYSADAGKHFELFDLRRDPSEATDISSHKPKRVERLRRELDNQLASWREDAKSKE